MEETKKLNWKPEDNDYLNKIFNKFNLILAFCVILAPLITSFMCLVGLNIDFKNCLLIIYMTYVIVSIISISVNFRFFKLRKLDILEILAIALLVMIFVSELVNSPISIEIIFIVGYFLVFVLFAKIDKKYYKIMLYTFVLTMVICSIMGVCDLNNSYMPGFVSDEFIILPMSLQFFNPNYSAYITIMAIMLCIYILSTYKSKPEQIIFWISYVVLNVCLFINGCYSAETSMFVGEIFLLIYLWIKNKKCPLIILICLLISIASSFVWIKGYSSSMANYMFESLAVIDNNLGTNLVFKVSKFFDNLFGTGVIYSVPGANGWGRADAKALAIEKIFSSPKSFFFGYGSGFNNEVLVHNVALQIWLESGVFCLALYISIFTILAIRLFKTKFTSHNIFMIALMIMMVLVCHYFACLEPYSFTYFVCLLSVSVKSIDEKFKLKKEQKNTKPKQQIEQNN